MLSENIKKLLKKQHYKIIGNHSAVQICRWTKNSLRNEGVCYKEKFYGIQSHRCCQMTPCVMWCPNKCIHCWRAIENTIGDKLNSEKIDLPEKIIDECIKAQKKLLEGFKSNKNSNKKQLSKANMQKWKEAQEPTQFAISLSGEPTIYPLIGNLIQELRKRGKTSFLVTNGLYPEKLKEIFKKNQMPTQLYISVMASEKKLYEKIVRSNKKNAWKKLNSSLNLIPKLNSKTRTVFRMNLIKDLNMNNKHIKQYAKMIKKYSPMIIEIKGYMSVGFARQRLSYDKMPSYNEMLNFVKKLEIELKDTDYKFLDSHERSRAFVIGKDMNELRIKKI